MPIMKNQKQNKSRMKKTLRKHSILCNNKKEAGLAIDSLFEQGAKEVTLRMALSNTGYDVSALLS